ncbi:diketogulonate reductase-like aldo/keto reductase [Halospina denitrificans]|uniref:Diketogulonate reductase-like aldo/keto reductase n=1 Tax=Halospina denitrificans TaxID=332522 RepID=A0A4R7JYU3_9GAMM|nr:aldo/keto reductase [Halospina denitrificans]TDT43114.1 diketogulonate reductase-like aldo/keto reductase [Halospina denitrificans]
MRPVTRRQLLEIMGAGAALAAFPALGAVDSRPSEPIRKPIPGTDEALTVIGMGTWQTFNVGSDPQLRADRTRVLESFFANGGEVVDSSPMYGSSQEVLGHALDELGNDGGLFAADKVWTRDGEATREQFRQTASRWNLDTIDLMQVHNLLSWEPHLETLKTMKAEGKVRYIGITTSHGRRHREIEHILESQDIDFVQLTYSLANRDVEQRLLPLARDKGIAVIANRPFEGGYLINRLQGRNVPLPDWAGEIGCHNWPQLLLKFIVSHPAVTCAIPATTQVEHMRENMGAARGALPDAAMRRRMIDALDSV